MFKKHTFKKSCTKNIYIGLESFTNRAQKDSFEGNFDFPIFSKTLKNSECTH